MSFSLQCRLKVERLITTAAVDALLAAGYTIGVSYERGFGPDEYKGTDRAKLLAALHACDDEHLMVYEKPDDAQASWFVYFVYGNDGPDVISDYSTHLEAALKPATDLYDVFYKSDGWSIVLDPPAAPAGWSSVETSTEAPKTA